MDGPGYEPWERGLLEQGVLRLTMTMWCAIRTFVKHAEELGNEATEDPVVFVKPTNCLHGSGPLPVSQHPGEMHHEVECVVKLGPNFQPVAIGVGLDMTDRAAQSSLRALQYPWAKGKTFRSSAVVGLMEPWSGTFDDLVEPGEGFRLLLWVNGEERQNAHLSEMSVPPSAQMKELLSWAPLQAHDLLFTGTPQGVGQVHPGDEIRAQLLQHERVVSEITVSCE